MRLTIDIPAREIAVEKACPVPLAIRGVTWKESCLDLVTTGETELHGPHD
jgi:hypothetical protein